MPLKFNRDLVFEYGALQEVAPGVRRIVARNPSPFTLYGTGTYVVGRGEVAVIDPGPDDTAHIDALLGALTAESVAQIVVTHTHVDHSPAAAPLAASTGAPIAGCAPHRRRDDLFTGEAGGDLDYRPDRLLQDGESIRARGWELEAIHTPGHTSNHLCYALHPHGIVFTGDHVMAWSTSVVSPPDGDMAAYMESLQRLAARPERLYWPTHGPAVDKPAEYLAALYEHRLERERMVLAALRAGRRTIPPIVSEVYAGLDPRLLRAAGRTTWAHLIKLVADGRVKAEPEPAEEAEYFAL
jgi:glyoxylase-like metal-dependent hydrolase (beta-lactamase superfamily II)